MTMYRGCTPVVDAEYGSERDLTPTEAVVYALATATDRDPTDIPPLYESIDPDALNRLFDDHAGGDDRTMLSFQVDEWNVFVRADGRIRVCDVTQPTDPTPVFEESVS